MRRGWGWEEKERERKRGRKRKRKRGREREGEKEGEGEESINPQLKSIKGTRTHLIRPILPQDIRHGSLVPFIRLLLCPRLHARCVDLVRLSG